MWSVAEMGVTVTRIAAMRSLLGLGKKSTFLVTIHVGVTDIRTMYNHESIVIMCQLISAITLPGT